MRLIKMFGLAAMALMAMAFAGTSSTMAEGTALCLEDEVPCRVVNTIIHTHEESVGKATLLSSIKVECNVLFLGEMSTALNSGGPVVMNGTFTYTNCGSCTVAQENGPAQIKVLRLGHETGDVTGEGLVKVVCSGFISCAYNGVGLLGTAKGPLLSIQPNGEVTISGQTTNKEAGGFLCPSTSKLDIVTTPVEPVYISR